MNVNLFDLQNEFDEFARRCYNVKEIFG